MDSNKFIKRLLIITLVISLLSCSASARGGGGCFLSDTLIKTPDGWKTISSMSAGDRIVSFDGKKSVISKAVAVYSMNVSRYYEITTGNTSVNVTGEQLFCTGAGSFKEAGSLKVNDSIIIFSGGVFVDDKITSIKIHDEDSKVFNLLSDEKNLFIANSFLVHNKGCFLPDTVILGANGTVKNVSEIKPGDLIKAFIPEGDIVNAAVYEVYTASAEGYYDIRTENYEIRATSEHPFYFGEGIFRTAESLKIGDEIYVFNGTSLYKEKIVAKKRVNGNITVYNLRTDWPNTFFANSIAVHNKGGGGGCFAAGTKVKVPGGEKAIESIKEDDIIIAVSSDINVVTSRVRGIFKTKDQILRIRTQLRSVKTTAEHPFMTPGGIFKNASELSAGDVVVIFDQGLLNEEKIISAEYLTEETVYNLAVDAPCTFIANGFVVHNKGGGGGSSYSGSSHSSGNYSGGGNNQNQGDNLSFFLFFIIVPCVFFYVFSKVKQKVENLDYCYPESKIDIKSQKTAKALKYLNSIDGKWEPEILKKITKDTFLKLQECWTSRQYSAMSPLMMTDLYNQHLKQIESLKRNHEINKLDNIKINRIDIIQVRHYFKKNQQEFTAIIEAEIMDYYVNDQTKEFIRGDSKPETFQEFWVFQRQDDSWLLREINQTRESDALREENFIEELTPEQMKNIYGDMTAPVKEKAPWLEDAVGKKSDKIRRLLNFLATTDKTWDEDMMKVTVRKTFIELLTGFEKRDLTNIKPLIMPETFNFYSQKISEMIKKKRMTEYRNLCVRKVDIVLVKNFSDNNKDEFTVRVSAHAQKIEKEANILISEDEYVSPFEEYWTFQKQNGEWKMREVQPPARTLSIIEEENIDDETSKEQLQWYYTKDRAL